MKLSFSSAASSNYFTLHCLPQNGHGQSVEELHYCVTPADYLAEGIDGLGNSYLYGGVLSPHSSLSVTVEGQATVGKTREKEEEENLRYLYLRETPLTRCGEKLLSLSKTIEETKDPLEYGLKCMQRMKETLSYQKGISGPSTTAEEALSLKSGVCQDYAHILLVLLRKARIPARYAAGLVVGEGETHAWVEVLTSSGWIGLDPTSGKKTDDRYLLFSTGADASDCLVNTGILRLNGTQSLQAKAKMEILEQ